MTEESKKKEKKRNKTTLKTRKRVLRSAWDISVSSLRQVCEKTKSDKAILSLSSASHNIRVLFKKKKQKKLHYVNVKS